MCCYQFTAYGMLCGITFCNLSAQLGQDFELIQTTGSAVRLL